MTDDREAWQEAYEAGDLRKEEFATLSFSEVPALGLPDGPVPARISYPGQFPYTRGVHPTGYRGRLWTQRQFAGFAGVADTNERFRYLLDAGQGGLSVAFDMPTLMGLDADDALAVGGVGHCGVAVSSSDDMVDLFDGIPLGEVSVSMTINGLAEVLFAFLLVRPRSKGSIGGHCEGPSRTTSSRNTSLRRSGSSLQSRIWARWMRERYGARDERSLKLRFHTQTAGVSLTAQQPDNNVVRTAIEALAAVLDGTQSLHTNALDEVYALPTAKTAEIALRTQQIIAEETGAADTIDPLGRSWFVEAMTDDMETRAEEIFAHIGAMGPGSMLDARRRPGRHRRRVVPGGARRLGLRVREGRGIGRSDGRRGEQAREHGRDPARDLAGVPGGRGRNAGPARHSPARP